MLLLSACNASKEVNNETIGSLDLSMYLGEWFEIARFDNYFERGMEKTKAIYTLRADGMVSVKNLGVKNGVIITANGKAKTTDNPALFRVSFFGPFYADYRILYVDSAYQYALVGSDSADYLWILSRVPAVTETVKSTLLDEAIQRGYDVSKFIWVKQ